MHPPVRGQNLMKQNLTKQNLMEDDEGLTEKIGKVYLIGAGPGDPKLLTIRAAEAIRDSDVIVYDYLVNPEVLVHSRRGATLIFAGKRAGEHCIPQSEI